MKRTYEDYKISTFKLEDEVNELCIDLTKSGTPSELINRVSDLGIHAVAESLDKQASLAAVCEICDEKQLEEFNKIRDDMKYCYEHRLTTDEQMRILCDYAPDFFADGPACVVLTDDETRDLWSEGRKIWMLDKNGNMEEPVTLKQAMDWLSDGGLVITSPYMAEKSLDDLVMGKFEEDR